MNLDGGRKQKRRRVEIIANTPQTKPTVAQPLSYHKLVRDYDVQDDSAVNIQPWAFRAEAGMSRYP